MTINSTLSTDREKVFYSLALFNKEGTEYPTGTSIFPNKKKKKARNVHVASSQNLFQF